MPRTLRLISKVLARVPRQRCYWKARWQDPWAEVPALWCDFSEWSAAPSMPVAGFRWQYGLKLEPGEVQFGPRFRENNRLRFFTKVVYDIYEPGEFVNANQWNWVGVLDIELDDQHGPIFEAIDGGDIVAFATGVNHFTAYGVESLLDCQRIRTSLVGPTSAVGQYWVKEGLQFNAPGIDGHVIGNRSTGELVGGGFGFHAARTGGAKWNSYTIVDYLLRHQTPADNSNTPQIPFVLEDSNGVIPDWDEPVLQQQGRTTRELLNSLISRQRVRGHYFDVVTPDGGGIEQVRLRPFSFSENLYYLENPSSAFVPPNHDPIIIACERDRGATLSVKRSAADKFDRICVQGAKRTSTATFSFADGTLDIGWPIALEELYEQAASTAGDYAALEEDEKFVRNLTARKADKLRPVYARFVLPDPFSYVVGDGLGEPDEWLTPDDEDAESFVRIAPQDRQFLPHLALRAGFDYTANNVGLGTITAHAPGAHHYLEPIVLFRRYDWTEGNPRYRHIESVGINAESEIESVENLEFYTAQVRVDHEDGSLWLNVAGEGQQHAIAKSDFTPLAVDIEQGYSDFRQMICTLTVAWSERVEQFWPEELPFGVDAIRTLTIDAGDDYQLNYIVPGTTVQLDPKTGALQQSTGGFLRDDRNQLSGIARLAYEWYGQTRKAISLDTTTISTELALGQLVVSLGDPDLAGDGDVLTEEVRSCITSLRIESPVSFGETAVPGPVKLSLQTAYGEMDPLAMGGGRR
jgi:hypothetical protein